MRQVYETECAWDLDIHYHRYQFPRYDGVSILMWWDIDHEALSYSSAGKRKDLTLFLFISLSCITDHLCCSCMSCLIMNWGKSIDRSKQHRKREIVLFHSLFIYAQMNVTFKDTWTREGVQLFWKSSKGSNKQKFSQSKLKHTKWPIELYVLGELGNIYKMCPFVSSVKASTSCDKNIAV